MASSNGEPRARATFGNYLCPLSRRQLSCAASTAESARLNHCRSRRMRSMRWSPISGWSFRKGQRDDRRCMKKGGPRKRTALFNLLLPNRLQIARRQNNPVVRQYCLQRRNARGVVAGFALGDRLRRPCRCVRPSILTPLLGKRGAIVLVAHAEGRRVA